MNIEDELKLSTYIKLSDINAKHGIFLVQHSGNKHLYVRKNLQVYDINVLYQLKNHPIEGVPHIQELIPGDNGTLILIEEYINGSDLGSLLSQGIQFDEREVTNLILKVCDILYALHRFNPPIIHRDIKPSNVMLTPDKKVYLIDYNAARLDDKHQAEDTVLLGTKGFAAPEQYGFGSSDITTDIYAIGMLMNTLLTGRVTREDIAAGRFEKIIRKCLQMDRSMRYSSVNELKKAIQKKYIPAKWMRFLPPGFRQGKITHMIAAIFIYLTIYSGMTGVYSNDLNKGINPWGDIIFVSAGFILSVLFAANYLDIQERIPILQTKKGSIRRLIIIGICLLIWFAFLLLACIFDAFILNPTYFS